MYWILGILLGLLMIFVWYLLRKASKKVHVFVNDELTFMLPKGTTLLFGLAEQGVFLPSACNGGGTCMLCKCKVRKGGGKLSEVEVFVLSKEDVEHKLRLACQITIKKSMSIQIPPSLLVK